MNESEIEDHET